MIARHMPILVLAYACISLAGCVSPTQPGSGLVTAPATNPAAIDSLKVEMEGGKSVALPLAEIAKLPHEQVRVTERDGAVVAYSGVPIGNILATVDAPIGNTLRGPNIALYIVAQGSDQYRATYSIVEADPAFGERHILIADQRDGQPLPARSAPLQVIVPDDKMQARWVRNLVALYVRRAP